MSKETLHSLVTAFASATNSPLDEDAGQGFYEFEAGNILLSVSLRGEMALMYTALGTLPETAREAAAVKDVLLAANALFMDSGGGCLGVTREGVIAYSLQYPLRLLDLDGFTTMMLAFANHAAAWQEKLERMGQGPRESAENASPAADSAPDWLKA